MIILTMNVLLPLKNTHIRSIVRSPPSWLYVESIDTLKRRIELLPKIKNRNLTTGSLERPGGRILELKKTQID